MIMKNYWLKHDCNDWELAPGLCMTPANQIAKIVPLPHQNNSKSHFPKHANLNLWARDPGPLKIRATPDSNRFVNVTHQVTIMQCTHPGSAKVFCRPDECLLCQLHCANIKELHLNSLPDTWQQEVEQRPLIPARTSAAPYIVTGDRGDERTRVVTGGKVISLAHWQGCWIIS